MRKPEIEHIDGLFVNIFNDTLLWVRSGEDYAMWIISEALNDVVTAFSNVWQDKGFLNNFTEQSHSWEANRCSASQETDGFLAHSQEPATCPYSEPRHSSHCFDLTSWRSTLILSSYVRLGFTSGLFPSGFPTKSLYARLLFPIHALPISFFSISSP
jgi:hypothetical protein